MFSPTLVTVDARFDDRNDTLDVIIAYCGVVTSSNQKIVKIYQPLYKIQRGQ